MSTRIEHRADPQALAARLGAALGEAHVLAGESEMAPFLLDQRGWYRGRARLVVRPGSTAEVAETVRLCRAAGVGIVPQGGNTGLVGGSVPDESATQLVLCLSRLNRVREIDPVDFTMTVEAGCILAAVQQAAEQAGMLFPLSLAAEGSCQIGGNLSSNAGGTAVLRYGNARDLVLGLEVVLADGRVWNGLRRLRKDNTGYALKHLFVGAEGTLGIITAAVLKLFPRPRSRETAFVAVASPRAALHLLAQLRTASGDNVTTFEYLNRACLELAVAHVDGNRDPFAAPHAHYVLLELSGGSGGGELRAALEQTLAEALERGEVVDAVLAESGAQAAALWKLRETLPEGIRARGVTVPHDVSVPVSRMADFLERAGAAVAGLAPDLLVCAFGHVGDGNLHFNLSVPRSHAAQRVAECQQAATRIVYDIASELDGSFSAEHGVGRFKREELCRYRSAVELDLMRAVKQALDPDGLMNPGAVLC